MKKQALRIKKNKTNILPLIVVPTTAPYPWLLKMHNNYVHNSMKALHYNCSIVYTRCLI